MEPGIRPILPLRIASFHHHPRIHHRVATKVNYPSGSAGAVLGAAVLLLDGKCPSNEAAWDSKAGSI